MKAQWLLAGTSVAFAVLTILVAAGATDGVDLAVMLAFQSVASYPLDVAVNAHTALGQVITTVMVAALLSLVTWRRFGGRLWVAPLFILVTGAVELLFKLALTHPSPPDEFIRAFGNPLGLGTRVHTPSSFPSGHVTRLTFLAVLAAALYPMTWTRLAASAFVAFTVFARVYIGDHWISDALAGLALGLAVAAAAIVWLRWARAERTGATPSRATSATSIR